MALKLSTGQDSTLGAYRALTSAIFGEDSKAVVFLDQQIAGAPNGESEEVIADESQMVGLLFGIHHAPTMPEPDQILMAATASGRR